MLHTWNQELGHHPHIHMMIPGNGPSLDGQSWIDCRLTKEGKPFLVDNTQLGRDFRDLFLDSLTQMAQSGELQLEDSCYIADLIGDLRQINWNVFIEGPPKPGCPPQHMLRYLTRYMTGGPISDQRIIQEKDGRVWFNIRRRDKQPGQEPFSLPAVEFVRRWTMHILPKEFTKARYFGCWTSTKRTGYLKSCRALVLECQAASNQKEINQTAWSEIEQALQAIDGGIAQLVTLEGLPRSQAGTEVDLLDTHSERFSGLASMQVYSEGLPIASKGELLAECRQCPNCCGTMRLIDQKKRPKWSELFYGPEHPWWFEWTSLNQCPPSLLSNDGVQATDRTPPRPLAEELSEPDIFDQIIALNRLQAEHLAEQLE